ncbi:MAG: hypothetical protein IKJ87_03570 [Ruminococcus sp.]|nr:hypothetical protein [Ruminococcus sp.]
MKNKIKLFLLCFLALSAGTVSGNSFAEDDMPAVDTEISEKTEVSAALTESVETVKAEYADITEYLEKIGTADGIDIYFCAKDIDDIIWEKNGGKPDKKSDYTPMQEALADKISDIKKLGDFVAVDSERKKVLAEFEDGSVCDEGKIYKSGGGRYLLYVNEEMTTPIRIRQVISTIDNPCLFSSIDGYTLELMDSDFRKVLFTYRKSGIENGNVVYYTSDKKGKVQLSSDSRQVISVTRVCAENDSLRLLVDDRLGNIALEVKETGYIWWSAPLGASRDKNATPLLINELRSSNVLTYGTPSKHSETTLRSSSDDCKISVKDIENGVRVTYSYEKGFEIPVEYTLEDDHIRAKLKISDIKEPDNENIITELNVMGSFGAADMTEEGYFIIPDGCGALVRFNNRRTMETNAYSQPVYGRDITAVPNRKGAVTEQIYLPMYGIVKDNNAMLVIAEKGDTNAELSVSVSEQSNSSCNLCGFTFVMRGTDTFYMSGSNDKFTVFETGDIKAEDIELLYYPISKEKADYIDVAEKYRSYLMENMGLTKKTKPQDAPVYVTLYGGVQKKKPVLGIPVKMKTPVTSFGQGREILTDLMESGIEDMVVSYKNWTDDGIENKVDTSASPSGTLGGKSGFFEFMKFIELNGFEFYPMSDNRDFYSGNGYNAINNTCVRISGSYSRIVSYDRAYDIPDGFKDNMSLLSPHFYGEVFGDIAKSYSKAGLTGASVSNLTSSLYGDYGKREISRADAKELVTEGYKLLTEKLDNGILAESANAYAIPYANHIVNVPLNSSRFDIFNEDIPFYQIVLHGIIPYSAEAINADANPDDMLLMAAATGSLLNYDMIYEKASELKDTEFDVYFYANHESQVIAAADEYKMLKPIYEDISEAFITEYETEREGKAMTVSYSNGTVIKVDFEKKSINFNGEYIDVGKIREGGYSY